MKSAPSPQRRSVSSINRNALDPFELLAVWCMELEDRPGVLKKMMELRRKARWRAAECVKTAAGLVLIVGLYAEECGHSALQKALKKSGAAGPAALLSSLGSKSLARQDEVATSMMSAIEKVFAVDWNGWRVGRLSRVARSGGGVDLANEFYEAMATQVVSKIYLPSRLAQEAIVPALRGWCKTVEARESLDQHSFAKLLEAMEAADIPAAFSPLPRLPSMGQLALMAHSKMKSLHMIECNSPDPVYFLNIKSQLEAQELSKSLPMNPSVARKIARPARL